jgi:hypothetical protein
MMVLSTNVLYWRTKFDCVLWIYLSYIIIFYIDNKDKKTSKPAGCEAVYCHEARRMKEDEAVNGRIIVSIFSLVIVERIETVCVAVFYQFCSLYYCNPLF